MPTRKPRRLVAGSWQFRPPSSPPALPTAHPVSSSTHQQTPCGVAAASRPTSVHRMGAPSASTTTVRHCQRALRRSRSQQRAGPSPLQLLDQHHQLLQQVARAGPRVGALRPARLHQPAHGLRHAARPARGSVGGVGPAGSGARVSRWHRQLWWVRRSQPGAGGGSLRMHINRQVHAADTRGRFLARGFHLQCMLLAVPL